MLAEKSAHVSNYIQAFIPLKRKRRVTCMVRESGSVGACGDLWREGLLLHLRPGSAEDLTAFVLKHAPLLARDVALHEVFGLRQVGVGTSQDVQGRNASCGQKSMHKTRASLLHQLRIGLVGSRGGEPEDHHERGVSSQNPQIPPQRFTVQRKPKSVLEQAFATQKK